MPELSLLLLVACGAHVISLPSHFARAKSIVRICSLRGAIDAVRKQGRCASTEDRYWDVEDFCDANGIKLHGSVAAYSFYGAVAACFAGISTIGLVGYPFNFPAISGAPLAVYGVLWLFLVLLNLMLFALRFSFSSSSVAALIEATAIWLFHVAVSQMTNSPTVYAVLFTTLLIGEFMCVAALAAVLHLGPTVISHVFEWWRPAGPNGIEKGPAGSFIANQSHSGEE